MCVCLLLQLCKCPVRESVTENLLAVLATIPRVMATTKAYTAAKEVRVAAALVFNYENG